MRKTYRVSILRQNEEKSYVLKLVRVEFGLTLEGVLALLEECKDLDYDTTIITLESKRNKCL